MLSLTALFRGIRRCRAAAKDSQDGRGALFNRSLLLAHSRIIGRLFCAHRSLFFTCWRGQILAVFCGKPASVCGLPCRLRQIPLPLFYRVLPVLHHGDCDLCPRSIRAPDDDYHSSSLCVCGAPYRYRIQGALTCHSIDSLLSYREKHTVFFHY